MTSDASNSRFALSIESISSLGFTAPQPVGGPKKSCQESLAKVLFHIANGQHSFSVLTHKLIRTAELAYGARDVVALETASQILRDLPLKTAQDTGLYYSATLANRRGDYEQARSILEPLTETASPVIKARSIQTLGVIHCYQNNFEEAARVYVEAAKAARDVDGLALFCAFIEVSAIRSIAGDHQQALDDLENLWPIVRVVSREHPHLFYQYHNELAVELSAVGRIDEARKAIDVAMSTPISEAYLEWQETVAELAEPISAPFIAVEVEPAPADRKSEKQQSFKDHFLFVLIAFGQARSSITDPAPNSNHQIALARIFERVIVCAPTRASPN